MKYYFCNILTFVLFHYIKIPFGSWFLLFKYPYCCNFRLAAVHDNNDARYVVHYCDGTCQ